MKIALVAPVDEAVPPVGYGGIELVVHYLAQGLAKNGHDVVLLAADGSRSAGRLVPTMLGPLRTLRPLRQSTHLADLKRSAVQATVAAVRKEKPDVVHSHFRHLVAAETALRSPLLSTIHYPLDSSNGGASFLKHPRSKYVSISMNQRARAPHLNFIANIHHGVPVEEYPYCESPSNYVAFVGRVCPEKGLDVAIDAAYGARVPLKIAAKLDPEHETYFKSMIRPRLLPGKVDFLGELKQRDKQELLCNAVALLAPVRWEEPFGLALVEAMACGTPVIGFGRGAVPEVVVDGRSGFVVRDQLAMERAIRDIAKISRFQCRTHVVENFGVAQMVRAYERVYRSCA